jgi:crotonobetainyl-CoA:carnitine CoA-transferase CaiB-like acyl-CoA transferase
MTLAAFSAIRVLDLTKVLAGPLCTQCLADLGANVIKVEPPSGGDETRHWPPQRGGDGAVFLSVNRNKRSLAVDLKTDEGRRVVHRLAETCDIVVESFATGVAERLGMDYGTVRAFRSDVIYCSISGFGRTGPLRASPGYDVILQAYAGIMAMTGEAGSGPVRIPISPIDQATGLHAYAAILARLLERQATGAGCRIEVSLYETAVSLLAYSLQIFWEKDVVPEKTGSGHESLCPYQAFATADKPLLLGVANDSLWRRFCTVAGLEESQDDARFATNPARVANRSETVGLVQAALRRRRCHEWIEALSAVGVPCAPVNTLRDLMADPHIAQRGMFLDYSRSDFGPAKAVAYPVTMDGRKAELRAPPPMLGEHTQEVLRELGFTAATIEDFRSRGIVR